MFAGCGESNLPYSSEATKLTARQTVNSANYGLLYSFGNNESAAPYAGLVNVSGTLYGTTYWGGAISTSNGTVFAVSTSGKESVVYVFKGKPDGFGPEAGLVNVNGTLYGTTRGGGKSGCYNNLGCGTVFSVTPSGTETVLHRFRPHSSDGANPYAGLVNVNGTLYGTTVDGGLNDAGTAFVITRSGKEHVLHSFGSDGDGAYPQAALINVKGTLYGTTQYGGAASCGSYGCGTVFSITPSGTEKVLYSFKGGSGDGARPTASLINVKGTFYGTTESGGAHDSGTVFSVTQTGTETVLYSFKGGSDGELPVGESHQRQGTLYGTTAMGGAFGENGTLFSITLSGKENVLHDFGDSGDGAQPYDGLINVGGRLYGTTYAGGANAEGSIFALKP